MPVKNANPYAVDIQTGARASDNPYAAGNPYAAAPDVTGLDVPTGEGTYSMSNQYGGRLQVPYSKVRQAARAGYAMKTEDRGQFLSDAAADKKVARLFPGLKLPGGVKIVGMNSAGEPMFGTTGTAPKGSGAQRFLSGAGEQLIAPITGTARALWQGPQNPGEARLEAANPVLGPVDVRVNRLFVAPQIDQAKQAVRDAQQGNWLSLHPTEEQVRHRLTATGHALAAVTPLVGPAAATIGEKVGTQAGAGDWAGAAGTVTGAAALEAVPKVGAGVGRYVTRAIPEHIVSRLIRPMARDVQFGKQPTRAITDEGIVAANLPSMAKKVADKMKAVGQEIDAKVANPKYANVTVDVTGAMQPLNEAIQEAGKAGDRALYNRLKKLEDELNLDWAPHRTPGGRTVLRPTGARNMVMSPAEALEFKRVVGDRIRWSSDALDEPVNAALSAIYGQVKDKLNAKVPELADLNDRYANLVSARKAIERRAPIAQRQSIVSLFDLVLGGTGHWPLLAVKKAFDIPAVATPVARGTHILGKAIPKKVPLTGSVPAVGVMQAQQNRQRPKTLRELKAEAARRNPQPAPEQAAP